MSSHNHKSTEKKQCSLVVFQAPKTADFHSRTEGSSNLLMISHILVCKHPFCRVNR